MTRPLISPLILIFCATFLASTSLRADDDSTTVGDAPSMTAHVLRRMAFGPRPGDFAKVEVPGWKAWTQQQLDPASIDDTAVNAYLAEHCPSLGMGLAQVYRMYQPDYEDGKPTAEEMRMRNELRGQIKQELKRAVLYRAVHSERQFLEVIIEFWRNHFNIDHNKGDVQYQAAHYEQTVLRANAFGRFEDMLLASAKHPAMLIYLDNVVSQKPLTEVEQRMVERFERKRTYRFNPYIDQLQRQRGLNENYARELMELHTLGVDHGYTQRDVTELARVLTGWTTGWTQGRGGEREYGFTFSPDVHDDGKKYVLGVEFRWADGARAGEAVIRGLARHPNTAQFISRKLCQYLVSDTPSDALVEQVARVYLESGGHLPSVYRAIIFSDAFTDAANHGAKFKTPFEFTVSALRAVGGQVNHPGATLQSLAMQGQPVYSCVDPTGYADQAEAWLDPGVLLYRWEYALKLARNDVPGVRIDDALTKGLKDQSPVQRITTIETQILGTKLDGQTRAALAQVDDVRLLLGMAIGSPEFQQQ